MWRFWLAVLLWLPAWPVQAVGWCADAPPPRLQAAQMAEVMPGIDQLRLRHLPAVGAGTVARLYQYNQVMVLHGPSCNGGYSWWRVELMDGTQGWVAEGDWDAYYLRPVADGPSLASCGMTDSPWLNLILRVAYRLFSVTPI